MRGRRTRKTSAKSPKIRAGTYKPKPTWEKKDPDGQLRRRNGIGEDEKNEWVHRGTFLKRGGSCCFEGGKGKKMEQGCGLGKAEDQNEM